MRYPYLNDQAFLKRVDLENYKEQFVRITILNFKDESRVASIEGKATSGSCNLSGTSNMRRTANCSLIVDKNGIELLGYEEPVQYNNITNVENLVSMNKKVQLEIGLTNVFYDYSDYSHYDKIWFPLGTYVIKNATVSKNSSGFNISLTLHDKCALLNGDMGGVIPATTNFSEVDVFYNNQKQKRTEKILIKDIIKSLVTTFGGERPDNIIITDIPDTITKAKKWIGKETLYYYDNHFTTVEYTGTPPLSSDDIYTNGMDIGFTIEPFVYPGVLEAKAGESVASVLDKIKTTLGNFEWFYDIDGRFVFQKIRNNLNESTAKKFLDLTEKDYLSYFNQSNISYAFDNNALITSIASSPQYQNIKNDFLVWGSRKSTSGSEIPIRYRLSFASKPIVRTETLQCLVYSLEYRNINQYVALNENNFKDHSAPDVNNKKMYYRDNNENIWFWNMEKGYFEKLEGAQIINVKPAEGDWRVELFLQALENQGNPLKQGYYDSELLFEIPKILKVNDPSEGSSDYTLGIDKTKVNDYWIEFLDGSTGAEGVAQFNIDRIGRRTKVTSEGNIGGLFPQGNEDIKNILIEADGDTLDQIREAKAYSKGNSDIKIIQIEKEIYRNLAIGGRNSAFEKIKDLIFNHTQYNESVTLSTIPIYHLEPNTLISVYDNDTGVVGIYLVKSMTLPLTHNGTSNITATKALSKTI